MHRGPSPVAGYYLVEPYLYKRLPRPHLEHIDKGLDLELRMHDELTIPPKVSERAFQRLAEINADSDDKKCLRVAVKGGGCSGFQYEILFDEPGDDDLRLENDGATVLIDEVSLPFLQNATIDFSEELIGSRFIVINPNAKSTCGCNLSFSL